LPAPTVRGINHLKGGPTMNKKKRQARHWIVIALKLAFRLVWLLLSGDAL
jgi:hypothetical protein